MQTVDEKAFMDGLRCMYYLNKKEIAHTTNFASLKELGVLLGNDSLPLLQKGANVNYNSEQAMAEMVEAIGLEEQFLREVQASPYYSIIIDEATDISVTNQLGLCIQYLGEGGNICVKYLKLMELSKGTADVITDAIVDDLTSKAPAVLDIQKMAGGACDGASVMLGAHNGVVSRLKAKVSHFIHTHCTAHRLSFAASHASSVSNWIQRFEGMLNQIYAFFSRRSTRTSELLEVQKALKEPQLKLQRATKTHWLSHQSAVDALRRSYQAVKTALKQEAIEEDATALVCIGSTGMHW